MKRLVQFVVLLTVVLLAAQPALGYLSCSQGSCAGGACPAACCGNMPGMGHGASMSTSMNCSTTMEALPASSGCAQPLPSVAAITREALLAGPAAEPGGTTGSLALSVFTPPASARAGGGSFYPALENHDPVDRGVLFHVFRI
jgi:hypothetical protein